MTGEKLQIFDRYVDLSTFKDLHVIGLGKGAPFLFKGLYEILSNRISGGLITSIPQNIFRNSRVRFYPGAHPIPQKSSVKAGQAIFDYITHRIAHNDLLFFLITGGASALAVLPAAEISFQDKMNVNRLLISSGANINEINCVRKHLSALKGGRLAQLVHPTPIISLILSDIVDSPLENIGSGPSIGDSTTFLQAWQVIEKFNLKAKISPTIKNFFQKGIAGKIPETPHPNSREFRQNQHFLIGENLMALKAAKEHAQTKGIESHILTARDHGQVHEAARMYGAIIKEVAYSHNPFKPPVLLISGGELTVQVRGNGKGGRNQEFLLHLLMELKNLKRPFQILSAGSDGIDGPTDAAGAWIDHRTISRVKKMDLDIDRYIQNNDSYNFFKKLNQLIITGPTHTNVMDIRLFYIK